MVTPALLFFALFGGICFTILVTCLLFWLFCQFYNKYNCKFFKSVKYKQAESEWNELQEQFLAKHPGGQVPAISLRFHLPFPSGKLVRLVSLNDGRLFFGKLDSYEFYLFVQKIKTMQLTRNVLQL